MRQSKYNHYLLLLASYLFLLAFHGYIYGHGDTIEVYPYAKWMMDPTLYSADFYIQNTVKLVPNERYLLAVFFSCFGKWMPWVALLLHFLSCTFLLEGLYRIGKKYIRSEGLLWLTVLVPVSLLYGINLGGNEMYIPFFTSGTFSIALGIWAILFFINQEKTGSNKNYFWAYGLLIVAGFIQPIVSVQLFVIITGILFFEQILDFKKERPNLMPPIIGSLAYIATAGIWIYFLNSNFTTGTITNSELFEFFEFRLPHHYKPSYYPLRNYLLLFPLFTIGAGYFLKNQRRLFLFFVLIFMGMLVFTLGVEVMEHPSILAAQWFKTSLWLKAFSLIAVTAIAESFFTFLENQRVNKMAIFAVQFMGIWGILTIANPLSFSTSRNFDFPFSNNKNAEVSIAELAKSKTPKDALFVIPIMNSHFKHYSERSSYVDYKAVIHRKSVIPKWYERVQEVYEINIDDRRSGKNSILTGEQNYKNKSADEIRKFKEKGVDYWLTFKEVELPFEQVASNEKYVIYRISE